MEEFANAGGMITEQLWDADDLPNGRMKRGQPTGAAMPLCWSHAEYISLVRSRHEGGCLTGSNRPISVIVANPVPSRHEIWTLSHPVWHVPPHKTLRVILAAEARIIWTADGWNTKNSVEMMHNETFDLWFADVGINELPSGRVVEFTFFWQADQRWEDRNWQVTIK